MKKNIFLFLFLVSGVAIAQNRLIDPELYVGVNYGKVGSMVLFNPSVNQTYTLGNTGGFVLRYIAEKNVGVQVELNYSQRGWKEANGVFERRLNYIELPFMTHIFVGNRSRFFINLGPKLSYLVSDKKIINSIDNPTEHQQLTSIETPFEYGVCGGLGCMFKLNKNVLQFETRTGYSINDIYSNQKKDYFDSSKNLNVSLNLSWMFQIK